MLASKPRPDTVSFAASDEIMTLAGNIGEGLADMIFPTRPVEGFKVSSSLKPSFDHVLKMVTLALSSSASGPPNVGARCVNRTRRLDLVLCSTSPEGRGLVLGASNDENTTLF